jgi:ATP phosphoribosyltransferase
MTESTTQITIALSKGRIFDDTLPLLEKLNIFINKDDLNSRALIIPTNHGNIRIILVRASDVPSYVQLGAADFGVAGKDILLEHGGHGLYQPIDLQIATCRLAIAIKESDDWATLLKKPRLRIATKYVNSAKEYFASQGIHVDVIKLYGSMELAPLVGLADAIVDIVSTGNTLKANNLKIAQDLQPISSHLIVNPALFKAKYQLLRPMFDVFAMSTSK